MRSKGLFLKAIKIDHHVSEPEFALSDIPVPAIGADEVLVEVHASAINPSDVLSAKGGFSQAKLPRVLGRDFAGVIVDGPADVVGREIWGSGGDLGISRDGTHAEFLSIPRAAVSKKPHNLSFEQAAAVGVPFQTAWVAVVERANIKAGEWIVISGATGAVGAAATQIAAGRGARVIALVRNADDDSRIDQKRTSAIAHLDYGDLPEIVERLTNGRGADVAINGVGAAAFQPLFDSLGKYGRYSLFSALSGTDVPLNIRSLYRRNITIYGVDSAAYQTVQCAPIFDQMRELFESGALEAPKIAKTFRLSNAAEGYQSLSFGKIVLVPDQFYTALS
jgi:NADPH2:quinone reductase